MAAERDYTVEKGSTFRRTFRLRDGDGVAIDISGEVIKSDVRDGPKESATLLFALSVGSGIEITDGPNGEYTYELTQAQTLAIGGCAFYDIFIELSGDWVRLQYGQMLPAENVTALP